MEQVRVLMNNVGSQAVDIIDLLHKGNIYIVYLSGTENDSIKNVADEFYIEKSFEKEEIKEYASYLINICKEKNIDIFIPYRKMEELSYYKKDFENNNIKVLIPDNVEEFIKLNNKVETYNLLKEFIPEAIPEYYLVSNLSEFEEACNKLRKNNKEVCMKYVTDIASNSFRIINFNKHTFKELEKKSTQLKSKISHSEDYDAIKEMFEESFLDKDLIVMEYMPEQEVSCDCLKTKKGNIIVPRIKINDKTQLICKDEKIMEYCNKILDNISYNTPCNIQFKLTSDNKPMLLEINTRMSGGIMIASWATNINIPLISISEAVGIDYELDLNWKDVKMISRMNFDKITL